MSTGPLLALFAVCTAPAAAQRYTSVYGRILDTSHGGIAGAAITVTNQDTGFRRVTQSETGGGYAVEALQPGIYKITVRKEYFVSVANFDVHIGDTPTRADFILTVGSTEQTITVWGDPPLSEQDHADASTGSRTSRGEI